MCAPLDLHVNFFGMWRSLVARLLWEQDVAGSNPAIPTGLAGENLSAVWVLLTQELLSVLVDA